MPTGGYATARARTTPIRLRQIICHPQPLIWSCSRMIWALVHPWSGWGAILEPRQVFPSALHCDPLYRFRLCARKTWSVSAAARWKSATCQRRSWNRASAAGAFTMMLGPTRLLYYEEDSINSWALNCGAPPALRGAGRRRNRARTGASLPSRQPRRPPLYYVNRPSMRSVATRCTLSLVASPRRGHAPSRPAVGITPACANPVKDQSETP
jgi:hypothetical protein